MHRGIGTAFILVLQIRKQAHSYFVIKFPKPHAAPNRLSNSVLFYFKALKNISKWQEECKILSVLSLLLKDIYSWLVSHKSNVHDVPEEKAHFNNLQRSWKPRHKPVHRLGHVRWASQALGSFHRTSGCAQGFACSVVLVTVVLYCCRGIEPICSLWPVFFVNVTACCRPGKETEWDRKQEIAGDRDPVWQCDPGKCELLFPSEAEAWRRRLRKQPCCMACHFHGSGAPKEAATLLKTT